MSKADAQLVALVRTSVQANSAEWDAIKGDMELYRNLYAGRFYGATKGDPTSIRVETGDGPAHIESYVASLFSRAPAVEIGKDLSRSDSDPRIPTQVVGPWLARQREVFEQGTRIGLLYPAAFFRVGPAGIPARRARDGIEVRAIAPWDVLLDSSAPDWNHQRWIGHKYTMPLATAKTRFPHVAAASWRPNPEKRYFDTSSTENDRRDRSDDGDAVPTDLQLVTIVEFYDLIRNKLVFWSADKDYGESAIQVRDIPLRRTGSATPLHPIVPLYFAYEPDAPLHGISTLSRLYDQLREKNLMRTNAAHCIRRDSRQFLARTGAFSEDDGTKITLGQDGAIIFVRSEEKRPLSDLIAPIQVPAMSSNFDKYASSIEQDLQKGSVLAAFTRGEATRATATEIGVLAEYSASAIGRMARQRDAAIEAVAELYLAHLVLESGDLGTVTLDGAATKVTTAHLDQSWTITALDQAGTPVSKAIDQQRFLALVPVLQALQVPPAAILAQLVRLELLPPDFVAGLVPEASGAGAPIATAPAAPAPSVDELIRLATRGRSGQAPGDPLPKNDAPVMLG